MRSACRNTIAVVAFLLPAVASGTAVAASLSISTSPALQQPFSSSGLDYTTTCPAGAVTAVINSPSGTKVRLDSRTLKTGRTTSRVAVGPGQAFKVTATRGSSTTSYSVRCLPADFPRFVASGRLPASSPFLATSAILGIAGSSVPYALVFDARGVPIWWKNVPGLSTMDVKPMPDGTIGFWQGLILAEDASGPFSIYRLDGTKVRDVNTTVGTGDPHESLPTSRGTIYRVSYDIRDGADLSALGGSSSHKVFDGVIQEIDSSGTVVWQWNSKDHLLASETEGTWFPILSAMSGSGPIDMVHLNSIDETPDGNLLLSFRHADAVYKIRKSDGAILWKLGGKRLEGISLTVLGDSGHPGGTLSGQHDARSLPSGDISIYDNGSGIANRPPRVTRWHIDEALKTATLVESFTTPAVPMSAAIGSARRLSDGGWLVAWGHYPRIGAYDSKHRETFLLKLGGGTNSYRAAPISGALFTRARFVAGMDTQYPR